MKTRISTFIWSRKIVQTAVAILIVLMMGNLYAQKKYALIIAVGDYDKKVTGWSPIASEKDVPLITNALKIQGFTSDNITVIKNQQATKNGIIRAIDSLARIVRTSDILVVHYSGHGQQIQDDNGDEIDGWDEALIPIDAHLYFEKGVYEGENHLRDDEFGQLLTKIRVRLGATGQLLVVVDACHSGTGTRGITDHIRGTAVPFSAPGYSPKPADDKDSYGLMTTQLDLAPMVCFYGAAPHQLNYEYGINDSLYVGSLSYAFSKAFSEAGPQSSYRGVFDQICIEMASIAPKQNPQSEGSMDNRVLGGKITGRQNHFMVKDWSDSLNITIDAGTLAGIHENSIVGLYDIDVNNPGQAIPKVTGKVVYADPVSADIELDKKMGQESVKRSWVFITSQNFGTLGIKVKLKLVNEEFTRLLKEEIEKVKLISLTDQDAELSLEEATDKSRKDSLKLYSKFDVLLFDALLAENNYKTIANEVIKTVISYAQVKFLRSLEVTDSSMYTVVELLPVKTKRTGRRSIADGYLPLSTIMQSTGGISLSVSDTIVFRITNKGNQPVYFSLLDIQPDNVLNTIIPEKGRTPEDYRIEPGKSWESNVTWFTPPYGIEVWKLIATEGPLDLSSIVSTRGADSRGKQGNMNPFESLIVDSFKSDETTSRGPNTPNISPGLVNISSVTFEISPKRK